MLYLVKFSHLNLVRHTELYEVFLAPRIWAQNYLSIHSHYIHIQTYIGKPEIYTNAYLRKKYKNSVSNNILREFYVNEWKNLETIRQSQNWEQQKQQDPFSDTPLITAPEVTDHFPNIILQPILETNNPLVSTTIATLCSRD